MILAEFLELSPPPSTYWQHIGGDIPKNSAKTKNSGAVASARRLCRHRCLRCCCSPTLHQLAQHDTAYHTAHSTRRAALCSPVRQARHDAAQHTANSTRLTAQSTDSPRHSTGRPQYGLTAPCSMHHSTAHNAPQHGTARTTARWHRPCCPPPPAGRAPFWPARR